MRAEDVASWMTVCDTAAPDCSLRMATVHLWCANHPCGPMRKKKGAKSLIDLAPLVFGGPMWT